MKPGLIFRCTAINEISEKTPYICKLSPAGVHHIEDLDRAGGIPAIMKQIKGLIEYRSENGFRKDHRPDY